MDFCILIQKNKNSFKNKTIFMEKSIKYQEFIFLTGNDSPKTKEIFDPRKTILKSIAEHFSWNISFRHTSIPE